MNWPEVQQRWEQMHLLLRAYWVNLTNDDLQRINGNRAKLAEALQRRYGYQPEQAENAICAFEDDVRYPAPRNSTTSSARIPACASLA